MHPPDTHLLYARDRCVCRQALTLAAVFEVLGALILGRHLVSSVTESLFNVSNTAVSSAPNSSLVSSTSLYLFMYLDSPCMYLDKLSAAQHLMCTYRNLCTTSNYIDCPIPLMRVL